MENLKTSERFTNAVTKLYNAFHKGTLDYGECKHCAVGNMCGSRAWGDVFCGTTNNVPLELQIDYSAYKGYAKKVIDRTGYSVLELANVENIFYVNSATNNVEKFDYFKGLCAVVEYLCELEGIPNVMDYTSLFETENEQPKKQLQEVFI